MNRRCCLLLSLFFSFQLTAQKLKVSDNGRYLVQGDGTPFFWLADTAWELFHRCNREEADLYLQTRQRQGFNVIQAVVLAELNGLVDPNPYGQLPLINNNPATPNPGYFEHVDYVIDRSLELGIYVALLPTWGDKLFKNSWGTGPEVFDANNARLYGNWIGERYKDRDNVIWILGGDRNPREGSDDVRVWNEMAAGIVEAVGSYEQALMSFHPQPTDQGGSSQWFHREPWLDFNMHQTGHCANKGTYLHIAHDYRLQPVKPVIDGEPLYEDHPNCFNARELGYSLDRDIRRIMYWNIFAGAFGQTYGCHDVWQMYQQDREGINHPLRPWRQALDLPMANQVKHLKNLMLSRPFLSRIPDQSLVADSQSYSIHYVMATRDEEGSYAMVYFPTGKGAMLDINSLRGEWFKTWWFDPRTGAAFRATDLQKSSSWQATPPSSGPGNDWILVIDANESGFGTPGSLR